MNSSSKIGNRLFKVFSFLTKNFVMNKINKFTYLVRYSN